MEKQNITCPKCDSVDVTMKTETDGICNSCNYSFSLSPEEYDITLRSSECMEITKIITNEIHWIKSPEYHINLQGDVSSFAFGELNIILEADNNTDFYGKYESDPCTFKGVNFLRWKLTYNKTCLAVISMLVSCIVSLFIRNLIFNYLFFALAVILFILDLRVGNKKRKFDEKVKFLYRFNNLNSQLNLNELKEYPEKEYEAYENKRKHQKEEHKNIFIDSSITIDILKLIFKQAKEGRFSN